MLFSSPVVVVFVVVALRAYIKYKINSKLEQKH